MARLIFALWEVCQLVSIALPYSDAAGDISRVKLELLDYRMTSKIKLFKCYLIKKNFLGATVAYFQQQYLYGVPEQLGFRVKKEYSVGHTNILTTNPARPTNYILSAYYGPEHFPYHNDVFFPLNVSAT